MPRIAIESLDDPRVAIYRELKMKRRTGDGELFIAEGTKLVDRLLASDFSTHSVLISERREAEWGGKIPSDIPLYVVSQQVGDELVGFKFHVGVLGCGRRKPQLSLVEVLTNVASLRDGSAKEIQHPIFGKDPHSWTQSLPQATSDWRAVQESNADRTRNRWTIVICPDWDNPENLGAIIRIGAAFGIDALLLGRGGCDPFSRRVLRVSMGAALQLPIIQSPSIERDVQTLRNEWNFELFATVLDDSADPLLGTTRPHRLGLFLGNEADGLDQKWQRACDRRLTIPMRGGTDSLNVAIAAGIFLHYFSA